jgi:four helix bundle protein
MSMTFEDLDAWKNARKMVNGVYAITREKAISRDFGLASQIQRAAVSVMSNVAEGFERTHSAEKLQAYNVARASCGEVRSLLYVIEDNYPGTESNAQELRTLAIDVGSLVSGLIASTRRRLAAKIGATTISLFALAWIGIQMWRG